MRTNFSYVKEKTKERTRKVNRRNKVNAVKKKQENFSVKMKPVFDIRFTIFICCVLRRLCIARQMFNAENIFLKIDRCDLGISIHKHIEKKHKQKEKKKCNV